MDANRRIKMALILSCFALTLKILTFVCPYWAVIDIHLPIDRNEEILKEEEMLEKGVSQKIPFEIGAIIEGKKMTVFLGLWYFVACIHDIRHPQFDILDVHHNDVCLHNTYETALEVASKASKYGPILRGALQKLAAIQKFGLLEYRIEVSIAVFLTMSGVVILFLYKGTLEQQRQNIGRMTYIALLVAGILSCIVTGKISMDLMRLPGMINSYYGGTMYGIHIPVPWCLVVNGVAAGISILVSGIILGVLTGQDKDGTGLGDQVYQTQSTDVKNSHQPPVLAFLPMDSIDFPLFPDPDTLHGQVSTNFEKKQLNQSVNIVLRNIPEQ